MKTTGERLKYFIELQGFSLLSFAKKNEINYSGLTQIVNNKRPLGIEVLQQLKTSLPNIDTEWLLFGTLRDEKSTKDIASVKTISDPGKEMLLKYLEDEDIQERILELITKKSKYTK